MQTITLRDYQEKAHKGLEQAFKDKKSPLLVMPTGTGKSITTISFIAKYKENFIFILIVKTRKLVDQLAKDAKKFNLDYGVYMASHDEYDETKEILVCSIDTINSRGLPHITSPKRIILIIDEADQSSASSYQSIIKRYKQRESETFLFGLTGTPWAELPHFDLALTPITLQECKNKKILVDFQYIVPKRAVNYDDIALKRGEWIASQVDVKLNTPEMIAYSFEAWQEFGQHRKTLIFCNSKEHANNMRDYINGYYGKEVAQFISEKTNEKEREQYFNDFQKGDLLFLISIRIITRGVDLPIIGCILDCAPTSNINLHIQKIGRGSRQNGVWPDCIVIDMAKNVINNGHFYQERAINLKSKFIRTKTEILENFTMRQCKNCFRAAESKDFIDSRCPYCKHPCGPPPKKKISKAQQERERLAKMTPQQIENMQVLKEFRKELWKKQNLGLKLSFLEAKVSAQFYILKKYGKDIFERNAKQMMVSSEFRAKYDQLLR